MIYVVKPKDTLVSISENYGVSTDEIMKVNGITSANELVVGQALIIPISSYTVKKNDTIYSIAKKFNIPIDRLVSFNNLDINEPILVGQELQIFVIKKMPIYSNAYVDPYITRPPELQEKVKETAPYLSYIAPFSYMIDEDGTLIEPANIKILNEIAINNASTLMMVITNIDENGFSGELGKKIMTDEVLQNKILNQAVEIAKKYGFKDVHFDFEYLPPETKEAYNAFLLKARDILHENNLLLSTALAPKTSSKQRGQWYEAHDYKTHGEIADFVVIMTYEWGYTYGLPLPISPIGPVTDVIEYALTQIPAEKIMLGQNLYGYDWKAPYRVGGEPATSIDPIEAINIAYQNKRSIMYDSKAQAPYFYYRDNMGKEHTVWFEDARSISKKIELIKNKGLRGISYWRIGYDFPQNWYLLNKHFEIEK